MVEIVKNNKIVTISDGSVHLSFKIRQSVAEIISHSENISELIPLFDLFVRKYSPLSVRIYLTSDSHLPKEEDLFIHHLGFKRTHSGHRRDKRWVSNEWPRNDSFEESYSCTYTRRKNKEEFRSLVEEHGFESHIEMMKYLGYHQEVVFDGYRILDEWVNEGDFLGYLVSSMLGGVRGLELKRLSPTMVVELGGVAMSRLIRITLNQKRS